MDGSALVGNVKDWICVIYNVENVCARSAWNKMRDRREEENFGFQFQSVLHGVKTFQVAPTNHWKITFLRHHKSQKKEKKIIGNTK